MICALDGGWFWLIPFADGRTSVGLVTTPGGPRGADRWEEALRRCPAAAALLRDAEPLMPSQGAQDVTVCAERFHGDGWALVGDAATFLDPIFSTGVALALVGGQTLARCLIEGRPLEEYEATVRRGVEGLTPAVMSFYDGTFLQVAFSPRERQNETIRRAIVSLLAGDVFDPAFDAPARFARRLPSLARMMAS